MRYLLDTHAWVWLNAEPDRVPKRIVTAVTSETADLYISAASIVEIGTLAAMGRLNLGGGITRWIDTAIEKSAVRILPLDLTVALEVVTLAKELHFDPIDRILAATTRVHDLTLITQDRALRSDRHVKTIW